MNRALVIGLGGIGSALLEHWRASGAFDEVIGVGSRAQGPSSIQCSHTEAGVAHTAQQLFPYVGTFSRIAICTGLLHRGAMQPEKRLEDVQLEYLQASYFANAIYPLLWLKALLPLVQRNECVIAACSARVGSISDNKLGGWYSYRAAKAGLNMLLQTASVEYARRAKGVRLLAFHPGTTNTPLSVPFQARVPEHKLFTPDFVADRLSALMDARPNDNRLQFIDWNHQPIDW
ncbi:SDR family NAD(P)-dependent oxidoreductase [Simiduia curdlanivorans]|uniref:SDR family NAD(P)-dependent oxidoreductase n=1 Tax=Simiduia curdlanivorans TaxID=1492769 RepID=A0ABV8VA15_9GAMM|nr:SDR family NAD(P)-dependent oxidoreductase [Simiduia curdlanivorans]MDN3639386.1 SDR family NAD(P)-dependent oxidoreductase [Simiduia curdlanivorans]